MAILVLCPGCKKSFKVSEKFAGKQGPCPSCKAIIKIPSANEPPSGVTIHEPEAPSVPGAPVGAAQQAKKLLEPIPWREPKLQTVPILVTCAIGAAIMLGAWLLGETLRKPDSLWLRGVLLLAVSIPISAVGYGMLRDEEAEPHRGLKMWLRATIAAVVYTGLWAGYYFLVPDNLVQDAWPWFFIAPPIILIGGLTGLACFDFDFATGCLHFCFYALVTVFLGVLAGMPAWAPLPT